MSKDSVPVFQRTKTSFVQANLLWIFSSRLFSMLLGFPKHAEMLNICVLNPPKFHTKTRGTSGGLNLAEFSNKPGPGQTLLRIHKIRWTVLTSYQREDISGATEVNQKVGLGDRAITAWIFVFILCVAAPTSQRDQLIERSSCSELNWISFCSTCSLIFSQAKFHQIYPSQKSRVKFRCLCASIPREPFNDFNRLFRDALTERELKPPQMLSKAISISITDIHQWLWNKFLLLGIRKPFKPTNRKQSNMPALWLPFHESIEWLA